MSTTRRRRLLTLLLGCSFLLVTACGSASGSTHPPRHHPKLIREPWDGITRGRNSTTLLIRASQDTTDRSSRCFIRYTTRVIRQTSHVIRIELLEPDPEAQPFSCPAKFVGPFFVPVHLKAPYRGQRLVDPVTGRPHRLTRRAELG